MRILYPPIEPFATFMLPVSFLHTLYVEQVGNPNGIPVVFLHGGPGGNIEPYCRQFFDPKKFHIILFDQRGAGKSLPSGCLDDNTTWHLVEDIEKIRQHLGISTWHIFGGSWGSTLALAYAISHPDRVQSLLLRGIFLLRQKEIQWFYQHGASEIFPDLWEKYLAPIPPTEREDLVAAYAKRLFSKDSKIAKEAAQAWSVWEGATSLLIPNRDFIAGFATAEFSSVFASIECHYFTNKGFFQKDGWLLDQIHKIKDIPGIIVQGRYDIVCPAQSAWDLHKAWPKSELVLVPDAGHSVKEPGTIHALVEATDRIVAS